MLLDRIQLDDDERILKMVRRHWFVLCMRVLTTIIIAIAPIVFFALIPLVVPEIPDSLSLAEYTEVILFVLATWLLYNWIALGHIWTDYYLDLWVITNKRIIKIDQRGLFRRSIGSFRLERLQDMNIEINGMLETFFNYGSIEAQTASGSEEEFQAADLPDPRELKSVILAAAEGRQATTSDGTT